MKLKNLNVLLMLFFVTLLSACGGEEEVSTTEAEEEVILPYEEGGARTAEDFYYGLLEDVKLVDEKLRYVQDLDLMDASEDSIKTELDAMMESINEGKRVLALYDGKNWPEFEEMQDLSFQWLNGVSGLANDFFYPLAEPMSRPDDTWTDEEKLIYADYETAVYEFYDIDDDWVLFQSTFAEANGFSLTNDPIDLP